MPLDIYTGDELLVIGVDLGTTYSAVSFAHLQPNTGAPPRVRLVTKWPGQEDVAGDCKIPSVIRYKNGEPVGYGVDAVENPEAIENTEVARWFKLHLHPAAMRSKAHLVEVPPLPKGVTLKRVYADMFAYLFEHTRAFFKDSSHDGDIIWNRLEDSFVFVCATPNGWDTVQQGFLRDAIIAAGILPSQHDASRLRFVTEAEASVHFALEHSEGDRWLGEGTNFAVLDAGGSTVDTCLYRCTQRVPKLLLEEVTGSECVQAGAVFVDRDAEKLLRLKLKGSKFGDDEHISEMMTVFERKTKRKFDGGPEPNVINFGRAMDNDTARAISRGRLTLTSDEVKLAFQNAVVDIMASCDNILSRSKTFCDAMLMVGGFSESPYLRTMLRDKFVQRGIQIVSIDDGTKKAAAEGTTLWFIKQFVSARAVRAYYGTNITKVFDSTNALHQQRMEHKFVDIDGSTRIGPLMSVWVRKHQVIRADDVSVFSYHRTFKGYPDNELSDFEMQVYACDNDEAPTWLMHPNTSRLMPGIRKVCRITGNLSGLRPSLTERRGSDGGTYWQVNYNVTIKFGQTTLTAELTWSENGVQKRGPLTLIPDSMT